MADKQRVSVLYNVASVDLRARCEKLIMNIHTRYVLCMLIFYLVLVAQ